jgi:hypothetical protein
VQAVILKLIYNYFIIVVTPSIPIPGTHQDKLIIIIQSFQTETSSHGRIGRTSRTSWTSRTSRTSWDFLLDFLDFQDFQDFQGPGLPGLPGLPAGLPLGHYYGHITHITDLPRI